MLAGSNDRVTGSFPLFGLNVVGVPIQGRSQSRRPRCVEASEGSVSMDTMNLE